MTWSYVTRSYPTLSRLTCRLNSLAVTPEVPFCRSPRSRHQPIKKVKPKFMTSESSNSTKKSRKRAKTSAAYDHYIEKTTGYECKVCVPPKIYSLNTSTTVLADHVKKEHKEVLQQQMKLNFCTPTRSAFIDNAVSITLFRPD